MLTPEWRKSSHSSSNANCVEIRSDQTTVAVRDSKDAVGPQLRVTGQAWTAFVSGIKRHEFDL